MLLASAASAQPSGPLAEARAALAAGDSGRAHGLVRDASRRGADDAEVWRLRLRLELAGVGQTLLGRPMRHEQIVDVARGLLRRAPADTLALRVLTQNAVWTALQYHDRVVRGAAEATLTPAEARLLAGERARAAAAQRPGGAAIRARRQRGAFDIESGDDLVLDRGQSDRARRAQIDAVDHVRQWLAADPGAARAYGAALTLAVLNREWTGALAVARGFQAASLDPRADLYAALALYRTGDAETAEAVFERAFERMSAPERLRFEGVALLIPTDLQDDYAARPDAVAALFWDQTDARLLTETVERRVEHYARVVEADLLFGPNASSLFSTDTRRGLETEQGQVWVRYGAPLRTLSYRAEGGLANPYDVWEYGGFRYVFDDPFRSGTYQFYSPSATAYSGQRGDAANDDYVIQDRILRRDDPQQTQDRPAVALDVPVLVSRFRAAGGGTEAVVAFGVPTDVPVPVTTGVFSRWGGTVRDRVVEERPALSASRTVGPVWAGAATVRFPSPGQVQVEVEAQDGRARGLVVEAVAPLADAAGGLGVSDLLLATGLDDDGRGPVVRDGVGIVPAARAVFATTDPVYVFLEAYGLGLEDGRTRYTVEATLTPEARRGGLAGRIFGRGQRPGVSVETEAEGTRSADSVSFFVDVRDQDPGAYTLRVEVTDTVTGRTAAAERRVVLE